MLAAVLLLLHAAGATYAFLKYRKVSKSEGFLAVAFVVIIFTVGWTMATMVVRLLVDTELMRTWYARPSESVISALLKKELNGDTLSLMLVTAVEIVFYHFFLRPEKKSGENPTSP